MTAADRWEFHTMNCERCWAAPFDYCLTGMFLAGEADRELSQPTPQEPATPSSDTRKGG